MAHTTLYLLGGSSALFDQVAETFVPAAGGRDAAIILLLSGSPGWEEYVPEYTAPWRRRGVVRYDVVVPGEDGALDLDAASARIRQASGIFIGGGPTPIYQRLYATEPMRSILRERYRQGVPVAGLSAGALIAPQVCAIPPEDTGEVAVQIATGLGLIDDLVVGVHFTEWDALPRVLEAMARTRTATGLGIDEPACAVLEGGQLVRVLGGAIYQIVMTDLTARTYEVKRVRWEP